MTTTYKKLREVRFNDGFLHRMNQGVLEWKSVAHGIWDATDAINLADIAMFEDLKQNPLERDAVRDQVRDSISCSILEHKVLPIEEELDSVVEEIFKIMGRE